MDSLRHIVENTLVPHSAFVEASTRIEQCMRYAVDSPEPVCLAIVGESRTGKTRVLEEYASKYSPVRTKEGLSIPILAVKSPSKPTVKGMAELMLQIMGDPRFDSGTENAKTIRLKRLMKNAGTYQIVLDEFQHFYDKGLRGVMHHMADWLKILVDDTKAALIVSGLPSCMAVLEQNEQLAGRFFAPVVMPRFDWTNAEHREEFMGILGAFQESIGSHFDIPRLDHEEMGFRCYCATGGLIGYLSKFLRSAVWNAIDTNKKIITLDDFRLAHKSAVWSCEQISNNLSPFSRKFEATFAEELIAQAREIGLPRTQVAVSRSKNSTPRVARPRNI